MMISIIIPIYKADKFIAACLKSIQDQTYKNFEVLCINDGSPDNSPDICQQFVEIDSRFTLINQENGGVSQARNTGLKLARGRYICFIDADDIVSPHYLEHLINLGKDNSFAICGFTRELSTLGHGNKRIKFYNADDFIKHIFNEDIEHPNICMMLFKRDIIRRHNLSFTVGCIKNEDTEFYVKYLVYEDTVMISDFKGYYYRIHPESVMSSGINMKSLTSIDAQERISKFLVKKNLYNVDNFLLSNSVQAYIWGCVKYGNKEIYNYLHSKYSVSGHMKKLLTHPRIGRKIVSVSYLILGKDIFYTLISSLFKFVNLMHF